MGLPYQFFWRRKASANLERGGGLRIVGPGDGKHWKPGGSAIRAMEQVRAVYSCVSLIADTIATCPLVLYRRTGGDGFERATDHPLYPLLYRAPILDISACNWLEYQLRNLLLYGNSYALIQSDGRGRVTGLIPLDARHVEILQYGQWQDETRLYYRITNTFRGARNSVIVDQDDILHIPGQGYNGIRGYSPIQEAAGAVSHAAGVRAYGEGFLDNGAVPTVVLELPESAGRLPKEAKETLRESWQKMFSGKGRHQTAILEMGMSAKTLGVAPEDAQLIDTLKWTVSDICGIFKTPPHLVGDMERATFSNIEHQGLSFWSVTLAPWIKRIEDAVENQLLMPEELDKYYVEFERGAITEADRKTRYDAYKTGRQWGWLSPNDIRRAEKLPPLEPEIGDQYLVPLNMIPAEKSGEEADDRVQYRKPGGSGGGDNDGGE